MSRFRFLPKATFGTASCRSCTKLLVVLGEVSAAREPLLIEISRLKVISVSTTSHAPLASVPSGPDVVLFSEKNLKLVLGNECIHDRRKIVSNLAGGGGYKS